MNHYLNTRALALMCGLLLSGHAYAEIDIQFPWGVDKQSPNEAQIQWNVYWDFEITTACYSLDNVNLGCSNNTIEFNPSGSDWETGAPMGASNGTFLIPEQNRPNEGVYTAVVSLCNQLNECSEKSIDITFAIDEDTSAPTPPPELEEYPAGFSVLPSDANVELANGKTKPSLTEFERKESEVIANSSNAALIKKQIEIAGFIPGEVSLDFSDPNSLPQNVKNIMAVFTEQDWNYLFPMRKPVYQYTGFLAAAAKFPSLCNDVPETSTIRSQSLLCKKELATMFAHFTQEVGAHLGNDYNFNGLLLDEYRQGLWYIEEAGCEADEQGRSVCVGYNGGSTKDVWQGSSWPGYPNAQYYGRGAKQLSYNYNYAPFSKVMYGNEQVLLENPHLIATEPKLAIGSAVYFYMQPRSPKPSIHDVVVGRWQPNQADIELNRTQGFGVTINVINGGVECGGDEPAPGVPSQPRNREIYYQAFAEYFDIWQPLNLADENNDCWNQISFGDESSALTNTYWERSWSVAGEGQLVGYEASPYNVFFAGDYEQLVKKSYYHSVNGFVVKQGVEGELGQSSNEYDPHTSYPSNVQIHWTSTGSVIRFDATKTDILSEFSLAKDVDDLIGLTTGDIAVASANEVAIIDPSGNTKQVLHLQHADEAVKDMAVVRQGFRDSKKHKLIVASTSSIYLFSLTENGTWQQQQKHDSEEWITQVAASAEQYISVSGRRVNLYNAANPEGIAVSLAHSADKVIALADGRFAVAGGQPLSITTIRMQDQRVHTKTMSTEYTVSDYALTAHETGAYSLAYQRLNEGIVIEYYRQSGELITRRKVSDDGLLIDSQSSLVSKISSSTLLNGSLVVNWQEQDKILTRQFAGPVNTSDAFRPHQMAVEDMEVYQHRDYLALGRATENYSDHLANNKSVFLYVPPQQHLLHADAATPERTLWSGDSGHSFIDINVVNKAGEVFRARLRGTKKYRRGRELKMNDGVQNGYGRFVARFDYADNLHLPKGQYRSLKDLEIYGQSWSGASAPVAVFFVDVSFNVDFEHTSIALGERSENFALTQPDRKSVFFYTPEQPVVLDSDAKTRAPLTLVWRCRRVFY